MLDMERAAKFYNDKVNEVEVKDEIKEETVNDIFAKVNYTLSELVEVMGKLGGMMMDKEDVKEEVEEVEEVKSEEIEEKEV